jgi:hypothetical protein
MIEDDLTEGDITTAIPSTEEFTNFEATGSIQENAFIQEIYQIYLSSKEKLSNCPLGGVSFLP